MMNDPWEISNELLSGWLEFIDECEADKGKLMKDTDLFILSRAQIIALVQASAGPECESDNYINFMMHEMELEALPENSIAILYKGSGGDLMMRSIKEGQR